MKSVLTSLCLLVFAAPLLAMDKADVEKRIRVLTVKFEEMQSKGDKKVPAEALRKAQGIILLDRTKAGFIFAYQGGGGMMMVKRAAGAWSAPAFVKANEASLGFQIGGQQSFVAILLMNTNAVRSATDSNFNFGGEASGTAGNSTGKAEGTASSDSGALVQVYTDSTGLYGGAAIKGDAISSDSEANVLYYGQSYTPREIMFGTKAKPSAAAVTLAQKITQASK